MGPQVAAGEAEHGVKHFSWEEEDRMSFQQVECQALTGYLCWNVQSLLLLTYGKKELLDQSEVSVRGCCCLTSSS